MNNDEKNNNPENMTRSEYMRDKKQHKFWKNNRDESRNIDVVNSDKDDNENYAETDSRSIRNTAAYKQKMLGRKLNIAIIILIILLVLILCIMRFVN